MLVKNGIGTDFLSTEHYYVKPNFTLDVCHYLGCTILMKLSSAGTTVTASSLFKTLPVRRQFYNNLKKKKDELKKIEDLLIAFSIILPKVRFTLTHDKERIFQKNVVPDTHNAILGIMGRNVLNSLVWKSVELEDPKVST